MSAKQGVRKRSNKTQSLFPVKIPSGKQLQKLFEPKPPQVDKDAPPKFKIGDKVIPLTWAEHQPFFKKSERAVITHILKSKVGEHLYIVHGTNFYIGPEVSSDQLLKEKEILTFEEAQIFFYLKLVAGHKYLVSERKLEISESKKNLDFYKKKFGIKKCPRLPARLKK